MVAGLGGGWNDCALGYCFVCVRRVLGKMLFEMQQVGGNAVIHLSSATTLRRKMVLFSLPIVDFAFHGSSYISTHKPECSPSNVYSSSPKGTFQNLTASASIDAIIPFSSNTTKSPLDQPLSSPCAGANLHFLFPRKS